MYVFWLSAVTEDQKYVERPVIWATLVHGAYVSSARAAVATDQQLVCF